MSSAFGDHRRRQHHHDPHHQQYRHRGSKIYAEHGTPYSCTQATIDKLQDMNLLPRTYPDIHMSIGEATRRLESAHRPGKSLNSGQKAALKRLQDLEKVGKYGPDIVLKIFNDLDTLLFQGVLNGNIYLCWSSDDAFGASGTAGSLSRPGRIAKRAAISLNKDILQLSTTRLRDVISTLVHECVHAYFMVLRDNCYDPEEAEDQSHGRKFKRCLRAVANRLGGSEYVLLNECHDFLMRSPEDRKWKSGFNKAVLAEKEQRRRYYHERGRSGW